MYVDNERFMLAIVEYKQFGRKKDYNLIATKFLKICHGLLIKPCFSDYSLDRQEDMISHALELMVKYLSNFRIDDDRPSDNPFSFFTRIAYNAFRQKLKYYKKLDKIYKSIDYVEMLENTAKQIDGLYG